MPPGGVGSPKRNQLSIKIYKFKYEKSLKLKVNPIREYLGLVIYPIKPSAGLFFLIKSRETTPLKGACHEIFDFWVFHKKKLSLGPDPLFLIHRDI
jgi:hypothetical protein